MKVAKEILSLFATVLLEGLPVSTLLDMGWHVTIVSMDFLLQALKEQWVHGRIDSNSMGANCS